MAWIKKKSVYNSQDSIEICWTSSILQRPSELFPLRDYQIQLHIIVTGYKNTSAAIFLHRNSSLRSPAGFNQRWPGAKLRRLHQCLSSVVPQIVINASEGSTNKGWDTGQCRAERLDWNAQHKKTMSWKTKMWNKNRFWPSIKHEQKIPCALIPHFFSQIMAQILPYRVWCINDDSSFSPNVLLSGKRKERRRFAGLKQNQIGKHRSETCVQKKIHIAKLRCAFSQRGLFSRRLNVFQREMITGQRSKGGCDCQALRREVMLTGGDKCVLSIVIPKWLVWASWAAALFQASLILNLKYKCNVQWKRWTLKLF